MLLHYFVYYVIALFWFLL